MSVYFVHRGRCVSGKGQNRLPQQFSSLFIKRPELLNEVCRRDEKQTAGGHDSAAVVLASSFRQSFCRERRVLTQRNLPRDPASLKVYRVERTPWRRDGGVAFGIQEPVVAGYRVSQIDR